MAAVPAVPLGVSRGRMSPFARAIETDRIYFELGATLEPIPGATLAWMPGLGNAPAGTVVHRVDPAVIKAEGAAWIDAVEGRLEQIGANPARIYLEDRNSEADELLRAAGYTGRDELVFHHRLPDPPPGLSLHPVTNEQDWAHKLLLHEAVATSPDGHRHSALDWVNLERRKCKHGLESFLAEIDGETVGAIGAVWGKGLLRMKNIVVHPAHRRRSIGQAILLHIAALGRSRGVFEQCILAVRGEPGEHLYRSAGMQVVGTQVEWSKQLHGSPA